MKFIGRIFILFLFPTYCNSQIIKTIAGRGTAGYSGDGGPAINAEFKEPLNVKFDNSGNMYIADAGNNVIRKINTHGIITTIAGNGTNGYSGDGGFATNAQLFIPDDITFDNSGNLIFSDGGNAVIRKIDASGIISTIVGKYPGGSSGDGGPATAAKLSDPVGLIYDKGGNLYFSDGGNARVRMVNTSGTISTFAGNGLFGNSGDNGPATNATLKIPNFLGISPSGEIYIADHPNNSVRKVNSLGIITTVAGNGTTGNTGDGGLATSASIGSPDATVFDNLGNYYISSYGQCSIRKVNSSNIISTVVGNGTCGYSGDGGPAMSATIDREAICSCVDAAGNLYIADSKNNRIRRVTYNGTAVNEVNTTTQQVNIYPNPARGEVNIELPPYSMPPAITVHNVLGQVVHTQSLPNTKITIDISKFTPGIYFVMAGTTYAGRFLKE